MDKEILKQLYKPICIHEYNDEYFDGLVEILDEICSKMPFEWYLRCIKFYFHEDQEFSKEIISFLKRLDDSSTLEEIQNNKAELIIFSQAILYDCIINGEDKNLASTLSLALNTIMYGREESLNQFFMNQIISFHRNNNKETIQELEKTEIEENKKNSLDLIITENKVLKWMLNFDKRKYTGLNDEQFALFLGKEFAEKCGTKPIFNYPEAYISKILISTSSSNNTFSKVRDIKSILNKLGVQSESSTYENIIFPLLSNTLNHNISISLIDFSIQVYYEQMLLNYIKENNYV